MAVSKEVVWVSSSLLGDGYSLGEEKSGRRVRARGKGPAIGGFLSKVLQSGCGLCLVGPLGVDLVKTGSGW